MTACHIYDDYMYGPDGEQKVKVSFVLALGSSDDPFTKAETWSPDGYADPEAANEYENMINSLQVVFYTLENEYYGKVNSEVLEAFQCLNIKMSNEDIVSNIINLIKLLRR